MVIHLNDAHQMTICEPMCLFAEARLPGCKFDGVLGAMGGVSRKTRPLWVFSKSRAVDSAGDESKETSSDGGTGGAGGVAGVASTKDAAARRGQAEKHLEQQYGKVYVTLFRAHRKCEH